MDSLYTTSSNDPGQQAPELSEGRPRPPASSSSISPFLPPVGASSSPATPSTSVSRIRRRNRMITSCLECRRRKLKCNKSHPCSNCVKFSRDCVFLAPALDQASQLKLTEIKEKVGSLERLLERDVAKNLKEREEAEEFATYRALPDDGDDDDLPANEDERDLEPTPLAVVDAAYEVDGDDDDLLDLGIQLGKMRITERIGGFFRPKIAQELEYTMTETSKTESGEQDRAKVQSSPTPAAPLPPASEWLKPGPGYITPSSGFFFGSGNQQASLMDFLPSRLAADRLIKQYFTCVHPICHILHRPTFEKEYDAFWEEVSLGIEPVPSVQTIVFAAMFSGVVSMEDSVIERDFGVGKSSLIENFKLGTETALTRANFLRTTKIETLQAFVMYLIPLCRSELSRAHSVLLGAAIRMAECMGLHRDGETYGMNPLETHIRRLVWYQICFLDIRTCEAQGPRPTIRRDEFDTNLPVNADDIDFHLSGKPPQSAERWTDATFSLIRFEINEMMRLIWVDRPRIESRKISLTAVLSKIETFRTNMAAKYDHLLDDRVPVQRCAKLVKALLLSRLHIMVLHRYHISVVSPMPERLREIMLASGTTTVECAVRLETMQELKPWSWYGGALQQYNTAFLLLMEVYIYPHRKEADQIWPCLDYIFECNALEPRQVKAKKILTELQQKTAIYQSMRGMRAPVVMDKHMGQRPPRIADSNRETREKNVQFVNTRREEQSPDAASSRPQTMSPDTSPWVGKAPVQDVQFAGVSNGDPLWTLPNQTSSSPEGINDPMRVTSQIAPIVQGPAQDDLMADIDWEAFDALFPPEQQQQQQQQQQQPLNTRPGSSDALLVGSSLVYTRINR